MTADKACGDRSVGGCGIIAIVAIVTALAYASVAVKISFFFGDIPLHGVFNFIFHFVF